jgi:uncharacterized membrane protein YbaN (DUF454 family)
MRLVVGGILVALGILGLILPVMPGWIFLIPGLIILSTKFQWAEKLLERLRAAGHHLPKEENRK